MALALYLENSPTRRRKGVRPTAATADSVLANTQGQICAWRELSPLSQKTTHSAPCNALVQHSATLARHLAPTCVCGSKVGVCVWTGEGGGRERERPFVHRRFLPRAQFLPTSSRRKSWSTYDNSQTREPSTHVATHATHDRDDRDDREGDHTQIHHAPPPYFHAAAGVDRRGTHRQAPPGTTHCPCHKMRSRRAANRRGVVRFDQLRALDAHHKELQQRGPARPRAAAAPGPRRAAPPPRATLLGMPRGGRPAGAQKHLLYRPLPLLALALGDHCVQAAGPHSA